MKSESFGIFLNLKLSLPTSEWTENREWGSEKNKNKNKMRCDVNKMWCDHSHFGKQRDIRQRVEKKIWWDEMNRICRNEMVRYEIWEMRHETRWM